MPAVQTSSVGCVAGSKLVPVSGAQPQGNLLALGMFVQLKHPKGETNHQFSKKIKLGSFNFRSSGAL